MSYHIVGYKAVAHELPHQWATQQWLTSYHTGLHSSGLMCCSTGKHLKVLALPIVDKKGCLALIRITNVRPTMVPAMLPPYA